MLGVDCRSIWIRDMDATEERGRYAWCIGNVAVEENDKNHMGDEENKWECTARNWSWKRVIENIEK